MNDKVRPDKTKVAQCFGQAAGDYDDVAVLQQQTGDELIERLDLVKLQPERIIDLGTGTGRQLIKLQQRYPKATVFGVDIAPAMLSHARQRYQRDQGMKRWWPYHAEPYYITGDAEQLPFADRSVDLVFANLAFQWCDPRSTFNEIARVLSAEGLVLFTTLGPDTLYELRAAWASVDDYPHVNVFYDMHDVAEAMMAARLVDPVLDRDQYVLTYGQAIDLMRDLKVLGASNHNSGRRTGLTGKKALQQVADYYEQFRTEAGLPATYEVIFGHAWGKPLQQQTRHADGSVSIPLSQIK